MGITLYYRKLHFKTWRWTFLRALDFSFFVRTAVTSLLFVLLSYCAVIVVMLTSKCARPPDVSLVVRLPLFLSAPCWDCSHLAKADSLRPLHHGVYWTAEVSCCGVNVLWGGRQNSEYQADSLRPLHHGLYRTTEVSCCVVHVLQSGRQNAEYRAVMTLISSVVMGQRGQGGCMWRDWKLGWTKHVVGRPTPLFCLFSPCVLTLRAQLALSRFLLFFFFIMTHSDLLSENRQSSFLQVVVAWCPWYW